MGGQQVYFLDELQRGFEGGRVMCEFEGGEGVAPKLVNYAISLHVYKLPIVNPTVPILALPLAVTALPIVQRCRKSSHHILMQLAIVEPAVASVYFWLRLQVIGVVDVRL